MIFRVAEELADGMTLARPVMNPGRPQDDLLKAGYTLTGRSIAALRRFRVRGAWVVDESFGFIDAMYPAGLDLARREAIAQVKSSFEALERHPERDVDLAPFDRAAGILLDAVASERPAFAHFESFASHENFLYVHSANVCTFAVMLGRALTGYLTAQRGRPDASGGSGLKDLALGAILHDIGNIRLSPDLRYRPDDLSPQELAQAREHVRLGYDMLRLSASPLVAQVALNHHQRWDGRGYPERRDHKTGEVRPPLAGESIPVFCRFLAPPDVFDTAVGERFFSEGKSPARALHEMRRSVNRGWFDPTVEQAFYGLAPPMPPGTSVRLSTGETAVVVSFNPSAPGRPKVAAVTDADGRAVEGASRLEIDLAVSRDLSVTHWLDQDVAAYVED